MIATLALLAGMTFAFVYHSMARFKELEMLMTHWQDK